MAETFDFGFTAVDEVPQESQPQQPAAPSVDSDEIMDKLQQLEAKILSADNSGMINEHRALIESDVATKLRDVEDLSSLYYSIYKKILKRNIYIGQIERQSLINKLKR